MPTITEYKNMFPANVVCRSCKEGSLCVIDGDISAPPQNTIVKITCRLKYCGISGYLDESGTGINLSTIDSHPILCEDYKAL